MKKIADLPKERTEEAPSFTYYGLDIFGPFLIKERKTELKRYGIIFTCLAGRAVHLRVFNNMEKDSFIQVLRRLIGRRGNIQTIRSNSGSNFVGAEKEMLKAFQEMYHNKIKSFLQNHGSDWIVWHRNPSATSHMGGIWERQTRSARQILTVLIKTHARSLDDEALRTMMVEVEDTISDADSQIPISSSNILTMKSNLVMPPPQNLEKPDLYCRKRWCRVQHITNEFWSRWRKEFLITLQSRAK